jgi:hypothetical protein
MKIIHTWSNVSSRKEYTNKRTIFHMILSLLCAKKLYDKVCLYTTTEVYEIIKSLDLPYDEINTEVLDKLNYNGPNFAIPKMEVYRHQTEPFLHIDTDTFLFERRNILENTKLVFALPDVMIYPNHSGRILNSRFISFYEYYYETFIKLKDSFQLNFFKTMPLDFIPNMSIFGGYDVGNIVKTYDYLVDFYFKNREILDEDTFRSPQIVEQMLFFPIYNEITNHQLENWRTFDAYTYFFSKFPTLSIIPKVDDETKFSVHTDDKQIMVVERPIKVPKNVLTMDPLLKDIRYMNLCGYFHMAEHKGDEHINNIMLWRLRDIHTITHKGIDHLEEIVESTIIGNTENEIIENQKKMYSEGIGKYYYKKLCKIFPYEDIWENDNFFVKKMI